MSTYELNIETGKEKIVVDFLKQLDFVKIRKVSDRKTEPIRKNKRQLNADLPYFGIATDWEYPNRNPKKS